MRARLAGARTADLSLSTTWVIARQNLPLEYCDREETIRSATHASRPFWRDRHFGRLRYSRRPRLCLRIRSHALRSLPCFRRYVSKLEETAISECPAIEPVYSSCTP